MDNTIAWIGYEYMDHSAISDIIKGFGINVDTEMKHAYTALRKITEQQYPLIIINDVLAVGLENDQPSTFFEDKCDIDNYPKISALTIEEIRKIPQYKSTPIIAIGAFLPQYTPRELYLKAGATTIFDVNNENDTRGALERLIKKYLLQTV